MKINLKLTFFRENGFFFRNLANEFILLSYECSRKLTSRLSHRLVFLCEVPKRISFFGNIKTYLSKQPPTP